MCTPKQGLGNCTMCRHDLQETADNPVFFLQKKADLLQPWALHSLAGYYDYFLPQCSDRTIKKNDYEAFRLYLLSAKQGFRESQINVAKMYYSGRGVNKSLKEAVYWLKIVAYQGSLESQCTLAVMIMNGEISGTRSDAIILFRNGANKGYYDAQFNLALSFQGQENPDYTKSLFWLKKAALQKNHKSQFYLAKLLFELNQDIPTAMYWLRMACESGNDEWIKILESLEKRFALTCSMCSRELNGQGKRCTKCKAVYYCSKDCQVKDWKENHKKECVSKIVE